MSEIDFTKGEAKAALEAELEKHVGPVKANNTKLMDELKDFKRKFDGIDPDEFKKLQEEAKKRGDGEVKDAKEFRERIEAEFKPKLDEANKKAEAALAEKNQYIIDAQVSAALGEAGVKELLEGAKAVLLRGKKVELSEGGAALIDGKPVKEFVQGWATADGKPYIAAADNSGGGARGSQGGNAPGNKKLKDMNDADKQAYVREHGRAAFEKLIKES